MDDIRSYPNMWVVFHDEEGLRIDNVSNPIAIKRLDNKQRYLKDFDTLLRTIEVVWDNRPDELNDKEEQRLINHMGNMYQKVLIVPKK